MLLKNLLRRKGRTLLTVTGIAIGAAAIIGLGALADGLEAGYSSVLSGTAADLVLSDPQAYDIIFSALDESIGEELAAMPEVEAVSALVQGIVQTEETPYFFVFGYPENSFVLERYQITEGVGLYSREAQRERGIPLILGSAASESLNKQVGDSLRLGDSVYRIVGIYETGDAFEEGGAILQLSNAQDLLAKQRQASLFYIKLHDPSLSEQLTARIERLYPTLSLSTGEDLADKTRLSDSLRSILWAVAALAVLIGGVGMLNTNLMAVMERTREIGVLRAVGWHSFRVMMLILGESVVVGLLGGILGAGLAWVMLYFFSDQASAAGATTNIRPELLGQTFIVVFTLGLLGGLYPAYRASRLKPIEAIRYEGGTAGNEAGRLPFSGMAVQNLWRRKTRTFLTMFAVGITIGGIMVINAIMIGMMDLMSDYVGGAEIMVRQRDAADTSMSYIDERVGDQIAAMQQVRDVSGSLLIATIQEDLGPFLLQGYSPREAGILRFNVVEGELISANRQIMIGRAIAEAQDINVNDTISLGTVRYQVVGIYESSSAWQELGGIVTLREAQSFSGRHRKVTFFGVGLYDPAEAEAVVQQINDRNPEVYASLAGEFAQQLPGFEVGFVMSNAVAVLAVVVGGVTMMNTMLMAVLERTREIGVLRALGWRAVSILSLILREALLLGFLGAVVGVLVAFGLAALLGQVPLYGEALVFSWTTEMFVQSVVVAVVLGLIGGIYPALRATRLQPVEAIRYE